MKLIETVCGPCSSDELGLTLMHEHLLTSGAGIPENYPQLYAPNAEETVRQDLLRLKERGVRTVVEASTYDLGRDVKALKRVSEATGIQIIACTGFFQDHPHNLGIRTPEQLASLMIADLTQGVGGTDIRAGIIKCAMDVEGPTEGRVLQHQAAAIASLATGAPIMLHSSPRGQMGRFQLGIFREMGVPMERIKVDHCLETTDMDYLKWLADQGCWLGVDRLPCIHASAEYPVGTETRLKTIVQLIQGGFGDRILLSHDFPGTSTLFDFLPEHEKIFIRQLNPCRHTYIFDEAIPRLQEFGVSRSTIEHILTENPKNFFANKGEV